MVHYLAISYRDAIFGNDWAKVGDPMPSTECPVPLFGGKGPRSGIPQWGRRAAAVHHGAGPGSFNQHQLGRPAGIENPERWRSVFSGVASPVDTIFDRGESSQTARSMAIHRTDRVIVSCSGAVPALRRRIGLSAVLTGAKFWARGRQEVNQPAPPCLKRHGDGTIGTRGRRRLLNLQLTEGWPSAKGQESFAMLHSTSVRTRAPAIRWSGSTHSDSLWLIPPRHGTKIMPLSH